ncbi:DEAD/DEAH box helicase family protein [Oceanotoga sp. DSM 15011]|uniref:DEAD/DEAH box helicase family protein n=1 Tax=Oceanotoga sp. DSM 15011 TaxID=2984951 RepID=UPI0039A564BB
MNLVDLEVIILNKIILRDYQNTAIKNFINNNYIGLLEMATGTGKTITSLSCSNFFIKLKNLFFVL